MTTAMAAVLAAVSVLGLRPPDAGAARVVHVPLVRFIGQVVSIDTPGGSPTRFTLQTPTRTIFLRIAPRATFTARSAEAEVEGLSVLDYAIVWARHTPRGWLATRIAFDVRPIHIPPQVTLVARVVRETLDGQHLIVRLNSGAVRWVIIDAQTRFRVDGTPAAASLTFARGQFVRLVLRRTPRGWIALQINLMSVAPPAR